MPKLETLTRQLSTKRKPWQMNIRFFRPTTETHFAIDWNFINRRNLTGLVPDELDALFSPALEKGSVVMQTTTVLSTSGSFFKLLAELVADLKRQELAHVDADLLRLKRQVLAERLEDFKSNLASAVKTDTSRTEQDLIFRGLGNTTVRQSAIRTIEKDAAEQSEKAHREYNRAIEEIALMDRKVQELAVPGWKKLLRIFGFYRR
jgi:hypothetical protein